MWGKNIKLSIFGESHGVAIGINIENLPSGLHLDLEEIQREMLRRAPGQNDFSTPRKETDQFEILSGYFTEHTTGTPLCAIIRNTNTQSKDYSLVKDIMRPGHADYSGHIKYSRYNDYRGGGHFSGRLTAPLVFAGAIAKQFLEKYNIVIASHIKSIAGLTCPDLDIHNLSIAALEKFRTQACPVTDEGCGQEMQKAILTAKAEHDSVGGTIQCVGINIPAGLGAPFFESLESSLAQLIFSVPAVKGLEFGAGFEIATKKGSEANDEIFYDQENKVQTATNNNGGIIGGITNGQPIVFTVAIKPTPSIAKQQRTININNKENTALCVAGRHDPCIVLRALPVIESCLALTLMDELVQKNIK